MTLIRNDLERASDVAARDRALHDLPAAAARVCVPRASRTRALVPAALASLALAIGAAYAPAALADCAADATPASVRADYARGQKHEQAGRTREALAAYVSAQQYTCDPNPVESEAARRAAALAKPLGAAAEKKGDLLAAYEYYESGAHYAAADRVLIAAVRVQVDDVSLYDRARQHFSDHALPAFQANNAKRLAVTGAYAPDPALLAEIAQLPAKRFAAVLARETQQFDANYLKETVALVQSMPENLADFQAVQAAQARGVAFQKKWPDDRLDRSRDLLQLARTWANRLPDAQREPLLQQAAARHGERAATLAAQYAGAPVLLENAIDYEHARESDPTLARPRVAKLQAQALSLGTAAERAQKYGLAAGYYSVAGDDARAEAAREKQRQLAMAKMQPQIDAAKRDAEALQARFSDPSEVAAMQREAEAARARLEQQQKAAKAGAATRQKSADDLAKELGL